MTENNKNSENKLGAKGYILPALVVVASFLMIYITVVAVPNLPQLKPEPSKYAAQYLELDADGNIVRDENGKPVKNKAGLGRDVYVREGCFYCHSQFVRPQDRDFGSRVYAGDYANETPNVLGTSRTGPDLSNEGGKMPDEWQKRHLQDPRAYTPGSIMPSFAHLSDEDLDNLVAYIQTLGRKRFDDPDNRHIYEAYYPEADEKFWKDSEHHKPNVDSAAAANSGAGIFRQNCAICHGLNGLGNGPNALAMNKKPANFSRPFFKSYSDETWYYKVAEGVPGTRMPRWKLKLEPQQMWYLVAYLKTLPQDEPIIASYETIDSESWNKQSAIKKQIVDNLVHRARKPKAKKKSSGGGH